MANVLPPPPVYAPPGSYAWNEWYRQLANYVAGSGGLIAWTAVSKSGADITDIPARAHNDLQTIQGGNAGEFFHMDQEQHTSLTQFTTNTNGTYNLTVTSNGYQLADCTSGAVTFNLPAATSQKIFHFKKIDSSANAITINIAGSDTIEGAASLTSTVQYKSWTIYTPGNNVWYIKHST